MEEGRIDGSTETSRYRHVVPLEPEQNDPHALMNKYDDLFKETALVDSVLADKSTLDRVEHT
ncbi:hypothetical protein [Halalkalicoccus salilacus]|uniref:hypothetical protein n=1 Tax=Halalkalicoccus salilacus TaxID=3117459 RepID=UPI00300EA325